MHRQPVKRSNELKTDSNKTSAPIDEDQDLHRCYEKICRYEIVISDMISSIDILQYEKGLCKPVVYRQFREYSTSPEFYTIAGSANGAVVGLVTSIASASALLTIGAFALGGAAIGAGAIALSAYVKNNWLAPINFEYKDIPFVEAKPVYTGGKFVVIESKPEQGIYRAQFYPEVYSNAEIKLDILVKNKRIEEITEKIKNYQEALKTIQDELAVLVQKKNKLLKEANEKEYALRREKRSGFFQQSKPSVLPLEGERKMAKFSVPLASDGKSIITYLQHIKKQGIPPETQVDNILKLFKDDKFDYAGSEYCEIIKELDQLGLLKNAAILQVIKTHPEQVAFDIQGYSDCVPSFIYPFWKVVSLKKQMENAGGEWQQSFKEGVKITSSEGCQSDQELSAFAQSLLRPR
jgi:hypothetical protein